MSETTVYYYVGSPFTNTPMNDNNPPPGTYKAGVDRLTGMLELASPLGHLAVMTEIPWSNIQSFAFYDGRATLTNHDIPANLLYCNTLSLMTDRDGNIIKWQIHLVGQSTIPEDSGVLYWHYIISQYREHQYDKCSFYRDFDIDDYGTQGGWVDPGLGTWSMASVSEVPQPPSGFHVKS